MNQFVSTKCPTEMVAAAHRPAAFAPSAVKRLVLIGFHERVRFAKMLGGLMIGWE
jgi:hypothetical protein